MQATLEAGDGFAKDQVDVDGAGCQEGDAVDLLDPVVLLSSREDFLKELAIVEVEGFAEAVVRVAQQFDPGFDAASIETRPSKAGNYLGVTITITATSREQLDELYRTLSTHPMVKVVL